ncbi:hypothetical protein phiK7B1_138 [Pseudomonas phage phiK7B1]|nr:hypothetical protein phiK7B1_138 [Pseudomonas phage phiK7B1]
MSRNKRKKAKQPKFNGTKIDLMVVDESQSLTPGLWASEKPSYSPEPVEDPIEGLVYAQGGILAKNPMGLFGDSRSSLNMDGIHGSFAGLSRSMKDMSHSIQKLGRVTRNMGKPSPVTVMVDSEMTISEETLAMILGPQKKQEDLKPTGLAKTLNPKLNNLCEEVELPARALSVEQHREFIRSMMEIDARAIKSMYYQKPSSIPEVRVELEGRKPHIQQFVDIVRKTNGKA